MVAKLEGLCVSVKLEYFLDIPAGNHSSTASASYQVAPMLCAQRIQNQDMGPVFTGA